MDALGETSRPGSELRPVAGRAHGGLGLTAELLVPLLLPRPSPPASARPPSGPVAATWTRRPGPHPLGWDPALYCRHTAHTEEPFVLEAFFSALLILVCVGVLAFTVVAVKKLYQGQR
ncbi:hypothetical protein STIB_00780 [Streptomyces sp. IB2014 011-1]|nr:hypothetical protein STIB_00780 [Streptomyces sp. IB2014 011-1]